MKIIKLSAFSFYELEKKVLKNLTDMSWTDFSNVGPDSFKYFIGQIIKGTDSRFLYKNSQVINLLKKIYLEMIEGMHIFFDIHGSIYPEFLKDDLDIKKAFKKRLLNYCINYGHQSRIIDNLIIPILERFKDEDFLISNLYKDYKNNPKIWEQK